MALLQPGRPQGHSDRSRTVVDLALDAEAEAGGNSSIFIILSFSLVSLSPSLPPPRFFILEETGNPLEEFCNRNGSKYLQDLIDHN